MTMIFTARGSISFVKSIEKAEDDPLISFDTVVEGADNQGWEAVLEDNGSPRGVKTDRVVEGFFSSERLDSQNDVVPLTAFIVEKDNDDGMPLIEYIAKRAPLIYEHANTDKGVVPLGDVVGWKIEDEKPKFRWAIFKGSPLVDEVWSEMKKYGLDAGFSIGGAKIEPECDSHKCVLNKLDVVEISWTPQPANQDAKTTFINRMAKAMQKPGQHPPGRAKLKRCVEQVMASPDFKPRSGSTREESAFAICQEQTQKAHDAMVEAGVLPCVIKDIMSAKGFGDLGERPKDPGDVFRLKPSDLELKEDDEDEDEEKVKYSKSTDAELSPSDSDKTPEGDSTANKKKEEGNVPPKDEEEDDEDMAKSDELMKALLDEIKGMRSDLAKAFLAKEEDDEEEDESEDKAKKEEDESEDDENEEKAKKALQAEVKAQLVEHGLIKSGGPERPDSTLAKSGRPMSKTKQFAYDKVSELRKHLAIGGDQ